MKNRLQKVTKSVIWKSIFRRGYKDLPRNRALAIFGNIFLHLHPVKIRESSVKYKFTWGMGGITFLLFLILTISGILLMFYYRPSADQAYWDITDLEFQVPFGLFLRNLPRWAGHLMVITVIVLVIGLLGWIAIKVLRIKNRRRTYIRKTEMSEK